MMKTFKQEMVKISTEASTPDNHDYEILMHNLERRIRNAAKKGKFFSIVDKKSRSLYRDGSNSVRKSAIEATMSKVIDELISMGFDVRINDDDYMRICWE